MSKTCLSCGKSHQAMNFCPWCGTPVPAEPDPIDATISNYSRYPDTKENRVIIQRIATKKEQIDCISETGPTLLIIFGVLGCITIIGIIFGIILIGIGIWWSSSRQNEKKKLQNEIIDIVFFADNV